MSAQTIKYEYWSQNPEFPSKMVVATLMIGAFLGYLNETLLNVALSTLMVEFGVVRTVVQWSATGFLLVMGALTPISASVLQWFETRKVVMMTLGIFLVGSLICAVAPHFGILLLGRLVQAVAAALTMPVLMNAIFAIYPPNQRGKAMGWVAVIFTVAPAIGPTLSGVIVDHLGWRFLFVLTVPFVLLAMGLARHFLKVPLNALTRPKIDILSVVLSVLGFGGLVFASSNFADLSWQVLVGMFVLVGVLIVGFVKRQGQLAEPLLDLRALAYPQFCYTAGLVAMAFFLFLGLELLLPMYMQQILLFSGTLTGLVLLPASVLEAVCSPIFGAILDKKGARPVVLMGATMMALSVVALWFFVSADAHALVLAGAFSVFGVALSSAMTGQTHGLNALPKQLNAHGTAIVSTLNPIAGALGASVFVGVSKIGENLSNQINPKLAMLDGIQLAMGVAVILVAGVAYLATRVQGKF